MEFASGLEAGFREVAEGIVQEVDAEDGEEEGGAGEEGDPGGGDEEGLALGEHAAPGDRGGRGAQAEEGEAGFGDHVAADADGGGHDDRPDRVRAAMARAARRGSR